LARANSRLGQTQNLFDVALDVFTQAGGEEEAAVLAEEVLR
jgi:hypothetical protein